MRANFFELEYNPKIDYLITKNLLLGWPKNHNEFDLRKVYKNKYKRLDKSLKKIEKIRDFLRKKKIISFDKEDYQKLIKIITNKSYEYHFKVEFKEMKKENLVEYVSFLKYLDDEDIKLSALSVMILYVCAKENEIIVPYRGMIRRILNEENADVVNTMICILRDRTARNNIKHDIRINELVRKTVKDKKQEFLDTFKQVKSYGVFGSFALHKENEYSDLDMVFISDDTSILLERDIYEYWRKYFDIEMDIKVVKEDELENELTDCMRMTLKMVK